MNLTRSVLATALVAATGITVAGLAIAGPAEEPGAVPVTQSALAAPAEPAVVLPAAGTGTTTTSTTDPAPEPAGITREAAVDAALAHVGGGVVESVERDVERGVPVWDVDIHHRGLEHDVDVVAATGAILRVDTDRDDDRDDDREHDRDDD